MGSKTDRQVYNPFLPLNEYIPDGEPHVIDGRVYLFGSHDREGGYTFCMEDYVVYSAPVEDLTDWRREGVIYRAEQDPDYDEFPYMYAPDVVRGNDGRYYLYYSMAGDYGVGGYQGPIHVAVCDTPAGEYEYIGFVRNPDGSPMLKYVCFDPGVINDDGVIRLYYGTRYPYQEEEPDYANSPRLQDEIDMYGRTAEEILSYEDNINGPAMAVLDDDMLTVKEEPHLIIPYEARGTSFEGHPFYEAASMRKVNGTYYFVYSSWLNHELCYATSDKPDRDFVFGGTIVSNGDVGIDGRSAEDRLNMTGTTHGSIENINGEWYVFYHRLTHKSDYSRQACAEHITMDANGHISQVEMTSCGLNGGPLRAEGMYPAVIACNLTNHRMPHGSNSIYKDLFPHVTHRDDERFIAEIEDNTLIGYKYFSCHSVKMIRLTARIETEENRVVLEAPLRVDERGGRDGFERKESTNTGATGTPTFEIRLEPEGETIGRIELKKQADVFAWLSLSCEVDIPDGVHALFLVYRGEGRAQLKEIGFE